MTNKSLDPGSLETLIKLGSELISESDSSDFDNQLQEFVEATERFLTTRNNSTPDSSSQVDDEHLIRFLDIHAQVLALASISKSKVLSRLSALERNRPALLKYLSQKK